MKEIDLIWRPKSHLGRFHVPLMTSYLPTGVQYSGSQTGAAGKSSSQSDLTIGSSVSVCLSVCECVKVWCVSDEVWDWNDDWNDDCMWICWSLPGGPHRFNFGDGINPKSPSDLFVRFFLFWHLSIFVDTLWGLMRVISCLMSHVSDNVSDFIVAVYSKMSIRCAVSCPSPLVTLSICPHRLAEWAPKLPLQEDQKLPRRILWSWAARNHLYLIALNESWVSERDSQGKLRDWTGQVVGNEQCGWAIEENGWRTGISAQDRVTGWSRSKQNRTGKGRTGQ